MQKGERWVKVRYGSEIPEVALSKKLFGYDEWETRHGTRMYRHKPIVGMLESVPLRRIARATIVLPEPYLGSARIAITKVGGRIRSVDPVPMDFEDNARFTKSIFSTFIAGITKYLQFASETSNQELGVSVLRKALVSTRRFTLFLKSIDEYQSDETSGELIRRLGSLTAFAQKDFKGARIEAGLLVTDLREFAKSKS